MRSFSAQEIQEFKIQAHELIDEAERKLLALERNASYASVLAETIEIVQSLQHASESLNFPTLSIHLGKLEAQLVQCGALHALPPAILNYFVRGLYCARKLLEGDNTGFDYSFFKLKPKQAESAAKNAQPAEADGSRVMVIDDETDIVQIIQELLENSGFKTQGYTDPKTATNAIQVFLPDVVITDLHMPEMSGLEVLRHVSNTDPYIPVIYLSGNLTKEVVMKSLSLGVFAALEKPVQVPHLISTCKNAAERYKLVRLLNTAISTIYIQYLDLDDSIDQAGIKKVKEQMRHELNKLMDARKKLNFLRRSNPANFQVDNPS